MVSFLNHIVFWGRFWPKLMAQMEDSVSLPPRSNDRFGIRKYLLKHVWVTEALNRPQKRPIWWYKVSFFNHIVSILYERGLQAEPSISCDSHQKCWYILCLWLGHRFPSSSTTNTVVQPNQPDEGRVRYPMSLFGFFLGKLYIFNKNGLLFLSGIEFFFYNLFISIAIPSHICSEYMKTKSQTNM